jgi:hypothetical protein
MNKIRDKNGNITTDTRGPLENIFRRDNPINGKI